MDSKIVESILQNEKIENQNILEVGTGGLILTNEIIKKKPKKFVGIEIDQDLKKIYLEKKILDKILFYDALKFDEKKFFNEKFNIISNLPFNISSELVIKWCKLQNQYNCIKNMILMFQEELGERIIAKKNTKKYGRLTILANAFFNISKKLYVSKKKFNPEPKVNAIVLKFEARKINKIDKDDYKKLEQLTTFFFNERRKKNKKKIEKIFNTNQIKENNLVKYFNLRPENLDKDFYYTYCKIL